MERVAEQPHRLRRRRIVADDAQQSRAGTGEYRADRLELRQQPPRGHVRGGGPSTGKDRPECLMLPVPDRRGRQISATSNVTTTG